MTVKTANKHLLHAFIDFHMTLGKFNWICGNFLKDQIKKFGNNFCGLVFKIVHHPLKGVLSFVRVYSGKLTNKDNVYNVNQRKTEKFAKLYLSFADEFLEV